jgi:hypothetical protein
MSLDREQRPPLNFLELIRWVLASWPRTRRAFTLMVAGTVVVVSLAAFAGLALRSLGVPALYGALGLGGVVTTGVGRRWKRRK